MFRQTRPLPFALRNGYARCSVAPRPCTIGLLAILMTVGGCRNHGKGTHVPGQIDWAKKLDIQLSKRPHDPVARRDAALLASAFLPHENPAPRYRALQAAGIQDPLGAYALGVRAMRNHDPKHLLVAAQHMLALEAKSTQNKQSPATAQVLDWLWQELQDAPKMHGEIESLWSTHQSSNLSRASKRALLSLIGKSRRLAGKPFAFAHQRQGCVQTFATTPVQGTLGDLSLTRANLSGPWDLTTGEGAPVFPLACAVRVWNPTQDAGFVGLQSDLTLQKAGMVLSIHTPATARVWLDGQEIWRNDQGSALSPRSHEVLINAKPGRHRLKIAVSIPGDKEWLVVRATDLQGTALKAQPANLSHPLPQSKLLVTNLNKGVTKRCRAQLGVQPAIDPLLVEPWVAHCALSAALHRHDREAAFVLAPKIEQFENFAEGAALLADADLQNAELPRSLAKSAASQKLATAVELDPGLLGLSLALAQNRSSRGQASEVRQELAAMKAPRHADDALFRFGVYLDIGDELRADRMLALAKKLDPDHCEVIAASFKRARDLDARSRQAEILPLLQRCPGYRALALRFWSGRGQDDKAKPLLDSLIVDRPDDVAKLLRRAQLHRRQGNWALAKADLERILRLQPASFSAHLMLADRARSSEDLATAKSLLEDLKRRYPNENYLYRYLLDLGSDDPLLQGRVDGLVQALNYQKEQSPDAPFAEDASVFVLDRDLAHVYDNGSQRHLIHQIIRVQSKEAIDTYGEITIPDNAELLTLRTIKQDGRSIEPEKTPGKSSFSMRALELGDYVEQEFIMPAQWAQARQGATDLGVFRFASARAPFVRSELIVQAPKSLKLQIEARNGAPTPTTQDKDGMQRWSFLATNQARVVLEPSTPSVQDLIPQVRCFANLSAAQWLDELLATTAGARQRGPSLRATVKDWAGGIKTQEEKLQAIYQKVNTTIDPQGDLGSNVNHTLASGKGSRSNLMYALLKEAKIPVRMLLVRSRFAPSIDKHPQFDTYETAVLEVWPEDPKRRRYLVPDLLFSPIGFLPEWLEGGLAHVLPEAQHPGQETPQRVGKGQAEVADRRELSLEIQLDDQGAAKVKGSLRTYGFYAAQWRQTLKQMGSDSEQELFSQYELPRFFPGKNPTLDKLKIKHADQPQKALVMQFELSVEHLGKASGGTLELSSDLVHLNPGAALVGLAQRKLDLLIASTGISKAKIALKLPNGQAWPASVTKSLAHNIRSSFGEFRQTPRQSEGQLVLEIQTRLTPQIVSPEKYPEFVRYVHDVQRAQAQHLVAQKNGQASAVSPSSGGSQAALVKRRWSSTERLTRALVSAAPSPERSKKR